MDAALSRGVLSPKANPNSSLPLPPSALHITIHPTDSSTSAPLSLSSGRAEALLIAAYGKEQTDSLESSSDTIFDKLKT